MNLLLLTFERHPAETWILIQAETAMNDRAADM